MLVLSRKLGEVITLGDGITIEVVKIGRGIVRLGITAPKLTPVHRQEVADAIAREDELRRQQDEEDAAYLKWWNKGGAK